MFEIKQKPKQAERALLVSVYKGAAQKEESESLLVELNSLVDTLGIPVLDSLLVRVQEPNPRYFVGSGKAEEIFEHAQQLEADVIVFDNELNPAQQRNWEAMTGLAVIDREEVILDIFAQRAQTKEARLQVDLARMEYSLPRLTRAWRHLGRQGGGLGGKGEGETPLETDRRLLRTHIDRLKGDLELVRLRRATQRKQRERLPLPNAAIVGYTNVGKSALLKKLTGAQVLVEDKLFATLEEAVLSDFLIHVLDASHPRVYDFYQTTIRVLGELGADAKKMITVLNKVDLIADESTLHALRLHFPDGAFVSVRSGEGLKELRHRMADLLADRVSKVELALPLSRTDLLSLLHRTGHVLSASYENSHVIVVASVSPKVYARVEPFLI